MKVKKLTILVSDSIGAVSAELKAENTMDALFVFAHGAGAGMDHPFMVRLSEALAGLNIGTLRFNFPYMEKGGKRPDPPAIAERAVVRAIQVARDLYPGTTILAGGKSFGGRMTSQALSKTQDAAVKGIVFVGFPLHAAGDPRVDRAEHLAGIRLPMLFLQGTRDALANINLMETVCQKNKTATLSKFEGADHSFKSGKQDLIPMLAETIRKWSVTL